MLDPSSLPIIARTPAVLRALLEGLPSAAIEARAEGGWCALDTVAHLVDRQPSQHARIELLLTEDHPTILDEDEQAGLDASGLRARPLEDVLALLASTQAMHIERYERLTEAELARAGTHSVAGEVSIADLLNHRAHHDLVHTQQIAAQLALAPDATRGNMAMFT